MWALVFPSTSPLCFRGCEHQGSFIHIWWSCPRIRSFWNKIFHLIRQVTNLQVPQTPHVTFLHDFPRTYPRSLSTLLFFMLLGAKLTLAKSWKQPSVSLTAAKRKISWIMAQEKMVAIFQDRLAKFEAVWDPWAQYLHITL